MAFKDGGEMGLGNEGGQLFSRRAALAGAAGVLALAGTGLTGCSAAGAGANDASTTSDELTDEQKKLHKQIVATYNVEKQTDIKEQLDADYAADSYSDAAPFVVQDPFGTDTLSCYVRFATTDPVTVSYKVAGRKKTDDVPKVATFSRTPHGDDALATEHEFKVIGLISNRKNTVTLTCTAQTAPAVPRRSPSRRLPSRGRRKSASPSRRGSQTRRLPTASLPSWATTRPNSTLCISTTTRARFVARCQSSATAATACCSRATAA